MSEAVKRSLRKFLSSARGATAVSFAVLAPSIIAAVGVASGSATYVLKRSALQSATDAAAFAAAKERAPPTFGACDSLFKVILTGTVTLNPGVYCGGLNIGGNAKVTFNPGIYII